MKRSEPPKRKTPIKRSTVPLKRTELPRATTPIPAKRARPRVTKTEGQEGFCTFEIGKAAVRHRSDGKCEMQIRGICQGVHDTTHHRKLRRAGDHRPGNLMAACLACHTYTHAHTLDAYRHGYLVWQHEDPLKVPIVQWVIDP